MKEKSLALVAAIFLAACSATSARGVIDSASLLRDLYDLGTLPILTDGRCRQFSSHNREGASFQIGNRTYYEPNVDRAHFLSLSEKGEAVLAEMKGPGAIVRIWSANPEGILKIYLDDAPEPVIAMPFQDFFTDPKLQPIRTTSSGGWISYYPIPYAKSCKVVVENPGRLFYHVNYQTYSPGTNVKTYTVQLDPAAWKELEDTLSVWRNLRKLPETSRPDALGWTKKRSTDETTVNVASGKRADLFLAEGAGCIDDFALTVRGADALSLRQAVIRMFWDGEKSPSVEAPLLDFFGNGFREEDYSSLPFGEQAGRFYCRFPMPFARRARIVVENGSANPLKLRVAVSCRELESLRRNVGRFHAKWRRAMTEERKLYLILRANGRGKFVGCGMTVQGIPRIQTAWNTTGFRYLEGDELIWVDGETEASYRGTGTEDYFNCGWYFRTGPVAQPLHGAPVKDASTFGTGLYRFQIPDYVTYRKDILVEIEHGGVPVCCNYPGAEYSSVAYFYSLEPHSEFFDMPSASSLCLPGRTTQPLAPK